MTAMSRCCLPLDLYDEYELSSISSISVSSGDLFGFKSIKRSDIKCGRKLNCGEWGLLGICSPSRATNSLLRGSFSSPFAACAVFELAHDLPLIEGVLLLLGSIGVAISRWVRFVVCCWGFPTSTTSFHLGEGTIWK